MGVLTVGSDQSKDSKIMTFDRIRINVLEGINDWSINTSESGDGCDSMAAQCEQSKIPVEEESTLSNSIRSPVACVA